MYWRDHLQRNQELQGSLGADHCRARGQDRQALEIARPAKLGHHLVPPRLARTTIRLPKGQAAHALRHTFAGHLIQNGGNIFTLQKILGHSSLAMTMRYAHLAPEHLAEAVRLNPLASVRGYALES